MFNLFLLKRTLKEERKKKHVPSPQYPQNSPKNPVGTNQKNPQKPNLSNPHISIWNIKFYYTMLTECSFIL